ncbi:MAG: exodeoxyribonuclease VII small subunit [Anaerolineales bacterium]
MPKKKTVDQLLFEEAFEELAVLVEQLEGGEQALEESLALFERGQALAAHCSRLLEQAELKLRQLVPDETGGYSESDLKLEAD